MPPALIKGVCEEILKRKFKCEWWGNIRFDKAFTPSLVRLMVKAGCIAVTGGLECANDRLLKLMNKGITLESSKRVLKAFKASGIAVHAYLMYAFPTQTKEEALGALDYVRSLFVEGLIDSAFWHRFALTVHSPVAANPEAFGITIEDSQLNKRKIFAHNEIFYTEKRSPDWLSIGNALTLAVANYCEGRGLKKNVKFWFIRK
jgi:coproporphyrinogen III oxidase-like Fe-S oxidoreductase